MPVRAGFCEVDITPEVGIRKIGWLKDVVSTKVLDPLHARAAVFESGSGSAAFVQLDVLSVTRTLTADIRNAIAERHGFPGENVMVAATHNHAGPAVNAFGDVPQDRPYVEWLIGRIVEAFARAMAAIQPVRLGWGRAFEFDVAHNRRTVMRDGTVRTHGSWNDPDCLRVEGPIDPAVTVLAAQDAAGSLAGCLVNFACHPAHHGDDGVLSAGYPGVLAAEMKRRGCPVALFLNGAFGNVGTSDPCRNHEDPGMEGAGIALAGDVAGAIDGMVWHDDVELGCESRTIELPFRPIDDDQLKGTARGAQRFIDPAIYERHMSALVEKIRTEKTQPAEVQALRIGECCFVSIPAEYFVEHGLRIKEESFPAHAIVVGAANGMVGYVPTREAFERGGYETTFGGGSRLAGAASDILAEVAIDLVRRSGAGR